MCKEKNCNLFYGYLKQSQYNFARMVKLTKSQRYLTVAAVGYLLFRRYFADDFWFVMKAPSDTEVDLMQRKDGSHYNGKLKQPKFKRKTETSDAEFLVNGSSVQTKPGVPEMHLI
jgi:hypothetical protein